MVTAKHNFQRSASNPANQKVIDFLDELQKLATNALGVGTQAVSEVFMYVRMPPHWTKSLNQALLQNETSEQNVSHNEKELELNSLEAQMIFR